MIFTIITLFPEIFPPIFNASILGRAQKNGKIKIRTVNLRDFGIGKHKTVDDKPYGGGVGMVLRVDVLDAAIQASRIKNIREAVILLDPKGKVYKQTVAEKLKKYNHIILICGHYEGFDERVRKLVDFEISIGDYVLSGGEIAAMVVVESVARLTSGVLNNKEAHEVESFSKSENGRIFEAPVYTRPAIFNNRRVPKELFSGDPKSVELFRINEAKKITRKKRPDLI